MVLQLVEAYSTFGLNGNHSYIVCLFLFLVYLGSFPLAILQARLIDTFFWFGCCFSTAGILLYMHSEEGRRSGFLLACCVGAPFFLLACGVKLSAVYIRWASCRAIAPDALRYAELWDAFLAADDGSEAAQGHMDRLLSDFAARVEDAAPSRHQRSATPGASRPSREPEPVVRKSGSLSIGQGPVVGRQRRSVQAVPPAEAPAHVGRWRARVGAAGVGGAGGVPGAGGPGQALRAGRGSGPGAAAPGLRVGPAVGRCLPFRRAGEHEAEAGRWRARDAGPLPGSLDDHAAEEAAPWSHTALVNFAWPAMAVDVLTRRD